VEFNKTLKADLVERVRAILARRGLTLYGVSLLTVQLYGRPSPYFLPHNLYYDLGRGTFTPSLHQLLALSRISDYRFNDWLRVFGFDPENIARLQVLLPSKRTMLLDPSLDDPESWIPWFCSKGGSLETPAIAPLGQLVKLAGAKRLRSFLQVDNDDFLYAKLGREDALAFPNLLPESIVRANTLLTKTLLSAGSAPNSLFLIEHANGFCCCRLQAVAKDRVVALSAHLPYAPIELRLPEEARVLGVLDLEIRSLINHEQPDVPEDLAKHWTPLRLASDQTKLSHLLRNARLRMGLSFRAASALSRRIASELGDEQYFAASGSLSDYETLDAPPRHIHKAITLCAVYGLRFSTFLKSIDLHWQEAGKDPIPDNLIPRKRPPGIRDDSDDAGQPNGTVFLGLLREWEPVPFFLRKSLSALSGLKSLSLHDFFWLGGKQEPLHPSLVDGLLVIVNRRRKKPLYFRSKPFWQQPLYVLLKRDGTYMCGCCSLENGTLVIHSYSSAYQQPQQLRNHYDAEVVGQVVVMVRRL